MKGRFEHCFQMSDAIFWAKIFVVFDYLSLYDLYYKSGVLIHKKLVHSFIYCSTVCVDHIDMKTLWYIFS